MTHENDQEKLQLLQYLYSKTKTEVDFLRERQDKIFTWSSNILMILIGALLIVDPSKSFIWSAHLASKIIASLAVLSFTYYSVRWQQRTRTWHAENGQVIQKIERLLHCFEEGYFEEGMVLFPTRWNNPENEMPPNFLSRVFRANYLSATVILGILAVAMVWAR